MPDSESTVRSVLAEVFGQESEIDLDASLIDVYGAESLDFLDVTFKLNKALGVKLFRGDFLKLAQQVLGDDIPILQGGGLTEAGVELARARIPEQAGHPDLRPGATRATFLRLFCGMTFLRQVNEILAEPGTTGEDQVRAFLERYRREVTAEAARS